MVEKSDKRPHVILAKALMAVKLFPRADKTAGVCPVQFTVAFVLLSRNDYFFGEFVLLCGYIFG